MPQPLRARSGRKRSQPVRSAAASLTRCGSVLRGTLAPIRTPLLAAPLQDSSRRAKALWSETCGRSAPRLRRSVCERHRPKSPEYKHQRQCHQAVSLRLDHPRPAPLAPSRPIKEKRSRPAAGSPSIPVPDGPSTPGLPSARRASSSPTAPRGYNRPGCVLPSNHRKCLESTTLT